MKTEEKKALLRKIFEIPVDRLLSEIHATIEEIMGRPVWVHELAFPQELYDELDGKQVRSPIEKLIELRRGLR